jgi:two-component system sensor histidine kinase DesK
MLDGIDWVRRGLQETGYTFGQRMKAKTDRSQHGANIGSQTGTGYIWIAYSVFFFIEPVLRNERRFWLECIAIYIVFLAIYVGYMQARTMTQRRGLLVAMYLLGVLALPVNPGASTFFIYSAAFLPFLLASVPLVVTIMVVQCLGLLGEGLWLHLNWISLGATAFFLCVVGTSNIFIAQAKRSTYKLGLAHEEIEQLAALAERERIARDLHDVLGHTLSLIVLKAELAGRLIERDPRRAAQEMADVEKTARTALDDVRHAIGGYRSQGLPAEMELARNTLHAAGVALACESTLPKLSAAEETVLCLAVREAVTNIVRHAHATRCSVRFATTEDGYHSLMVADDGTHPIRQEGNGLRGMRERVETLGGRLSITNDNGTALLVELPVTKAAATGSPECIAL